MDVKNSRSNWVGALSRFAADTRGGFTHMFSLMLVPLVVTMGGSVDITQVYRANSSIDSMADSAALVGVGATVMKETLSWDDQKIASVAATTRLFEQLLAGSPQRGLTVTSKAYTATVNGNVLNMKVCWEATQKMAFLPITGIQEMKLKGCSAAESAAPTFATFYFLVDASGSMGIGATAADQLIMNNKMGCTFACHAANWIKSQYPNCNAGSGWWNSTPYCANYFGAKTRFDVVRDALKTVVDTGQASMKISEQFKFAVYKFSNDITAIQTETTNFDAVRTAVQNMTMDETGGTNFTYALQRMNTVIPNSGTGKTASDPKIFLVLMTDGVEGNVREYQNTSSGCWGVKPAWCGDWSPDPNFVVNSPGFYSGSERSQAINATKCTTIKNRGIRISTLNTEYLVPAVGGSDWRYQQIKAQLVPVIKQTMQNCASDPSYAYYATTPGEIQSATDLMFKSLMAKARLVN